MNIRINSEIYINANPDKVWSIFTNFDNYPIWNPFIKSIKGNVKIGNKIRVNIQPPESNVITFNPKILNFETKKELKWLGHFLFKGLFDGEHKFELIENQDGTTIFKQNEIFKGILVPFFKKQLETNTKKGFEQMNSILKELAEQD